MTAPRRVCHGSAYGGATSIADDIADWAEGAGDVVVGAWEDVTGWFIGNTNTVSNWFSSLFSWF
jgi:hypothetical protein